MMLDNVKELPPKSKRAEGWPEVCLYSWRETLRRWEDAGDDYTMSLGTLNALRHTLECACLLVEELKETQMQIPVTFIEKLVVQDGLLDELVAKTSNEVDNMVLDQAKTALTFMKDNKELINTFTKWLNVPITFSKTPNAPGELLADPGDMPEALKGLGPNAFTELKALLLDCCDEEDCKC